MTTAAGSFHATPQDGRAYDRRVSAAYRLNRLFHAASGRCIDVAVDHGFFGESRFLAGIEDMAARGRDAGRGAPDAIQLSPGQAPLLQGLPGRTSPPWCCASTSPTSTASEPPREAFSHVIDDAIGHAVRLDAACVCVNLFDIPGADALRRECIENITALRTAADRVGMAVMVEPLVMTPASVATASTATPTASSRSSAKPPSSAPTSSRPTPPTTWPPTTASLPRGASRSSSVAAAACPTRRSSPARGPSWTRARAGSSTGATSSSTPTRRPWSARCEASCTETASDGAARPRRHRRRGPHGPRARRRHRALERPGGPSRVPELVGVCDTSPEALRWFDRIAVGHPQDDRPPPPARGRLHRRPLPRGPAPSPRGALPRRDRRRQGLPGREALRRRPRRRRADRRRGGGRRRLRALLQRDALLPRRAARLRDDRGGRAGPGDRGPARLPALQRPRPRQADQLEAPGALLRSDRRDGRSRDARRPPAAAAGLASGHRLRPAERHRHRAPRPPDGRARPVRHDRQRHAAVRRRLPADPAHPPDRARAHEHLAHHGDSAWTAA